MSFHSVAYSDWPLGQIVPSLKAMGYDALEVNAETLPWATPHVTPATTVAERRSIRDLVQGHGLQISSVCAHMGFLDTDQGARKAAVEFTKGCVSLAEDLGTDIVHGLSGVPPVDVEEEKCWEWLAGAVDECARYAADREIRFAFEAITGMLVRRVADLQRLRAMTSWPVYVNFDPSHLVVEGEDPAEAVHLLGSAIVHVHIKDADGIPARYKFPPLGQGQVDFRAMVRALKAVGYSGALSVEEESYLFGYPKDPEAAARQGIAFLRVLLSED